MIVMLLLAACCAIQEDETPASEGALDNDAFLPVSEAALSALRSGDQARARSLEAASREQRAEAQRLEESAFDDWHSALSSSEAGDGVWYDLEPQALHRLAEGVHAAVWRRLTALDPAERATWSARYEEDARAAVESALFLWDAGERRQALTEVVRRHPLTQGAARAALWLCDEALEAGLVARASSWSELALREVESSGAGELRSALEIRRSRLTPRSPAEPEAWMRAGACQPGGAFAWENRDPHPAGERRIRPGLAFISPDEVVLQTARDVWILALAASGAVEAEARIDPADFLFGFTPDSQFDATREPPGWPLLPLADAGGLVLVIGRTQEGDPNALLSLELARDVRLRALAPKLGRDEPAARLRWAIIGAERFDGQTTTTITELEALGPLEFQPGPVASGDLVVVQAREDVGQTRAWLFAFDRRTGALAWKRLLSAGADLVAGGRFAPAVQHVAGQPLLALESDGRARVFAGTHLGVGALYDAVLGEPLWSFKCRRRDARSAGWNGDRPLASLGDETRSILWAPMDSDRLYELRPTLAGPESEEAAAVLRFPPTPLFEARTLIGGDQEGILAFARAGRERTLSSFRSGANGIETVELLPDEHFRGLGLCSPTRVWISTNRAVYLFDRERELYLLDREPLAPAGDDAPGGDLYAQGAHVLVLGSSALWSLRAR